MVDFFVLEVPLGIFVAALACFYELLFGVLVSCWMMKLLMKHFFRMQKYYTDSSSPLLGALGSITFVLLYKI